MRYLSLFSGIEAASCAWQPLGWELAGVCEIEKFPCNVLKHHYPDVPNLGDITKLTAEDLEKFKDVDLIVGGSPCQSFSTAGKQTGLEGVSRLAYDYIRVLDYIRPKYFVWENVPGVLSTHKGEDFEFLLNQWESLGYILETNILDAQYFGVAQRRRRIFVWGINRVILAQNKSHTLDLIMGNNLMQILQQLLVEQKDLLNLQEKNLDCPVELSVGLQKNLTLFLSGGMNESLWKLLLKNLGDASLKLVGNLDSWASVVGTTTLGMTVKEGFTSDTSTVNASTNIDILWKRSLADLLNLMKSCTTSTVTARTMILLICTFAKIVPSIALLIALSKSCLPSWCRKDTLNSTVLQEFIKYARQASKQMVFSPSTYFDWAIILRVTELTADFIRHFGDKCNFTEVLFESQSLPGYFETLKRTKEKLTASAKRSSGKTGGCYDMSHPCDVIRTCDDNKTPTLEARMRTGGNQIPLVLGMNHIAEKAESVVVGKMTTMAARQYKNLPIILDDQGGRVMNVSDDGKVGTLRAETHNHQPIVIESYRIGSYHSSGMKSDNLHSGIYETETANTLDASDPTPACQQGSIAVCSHARVRKLTPKECLRLQGFPDDWFDGVEGYSDTAAYKAIGNSMAVPCMRWIGERIQEVEKE